MSYEIQGKVGPVVAADGSLADVRLGRDLCTTIVEGHGRYYENASRGLTLVASTATAGIAPGTALSASPALALANPAGSGKNLSILKVFYGYVSGTLGTGVLWYVQGINPAALPAETTAAFRSSALMSGATAPNNDVAKTYSGVSLTNTPVAVRPSAFSLNPYAGGASPLTLNPPLWEEIGGDLIIQPGGWFGIEGIAGAGTTPLVVLGVTYEVVPQ